MTALSQSTKRKLSLLQLAEELGNVAKACKIMGYHRDTFYEVRRAFQVGGVSSLIEHKRGPRNPHPNRVSADIEQRILAYCLERPTHGAERVANELRLQGVSVSLGGVRGVWLRHDLETRYKRLMRLETAAREQTFVLSPEQIALLERHSSEFRLRLCRSEPSWRTAQSGYVLLGHAQRSRQSLRAGGGRRVLLARLRQGVQLQDAGHCV